MHSSTFQNLTQANDQPSDTDQRVSIAAAEAIRLLSVLPDDQRMRDEAASVHLSADTYADTGSVDLIALDKRLRRMRIAAVQGAFPARWPDESLND